MSLRRLTDFRISTRLQLLSALLLLSTLLIGLTGLFTNRLGFQEQHRLLSQTALIERSVDTARDAQVQFKIQVQEWKNILLRGHRDAELLERYRHALLDSGQKVQHRLAELESLLPRVGMDAGRAREVGEQLADLQDHYLQALQHYRVGDDTSASRVDGLVTGIDRQPTEMLDQLVDEVLSVSAERRAAAEAQNAEHYAQIRLLLLALLALSLAIGILTAWWLSRSITRPLGVAVNVARQVAAGNLSTRIQVSGKDETAQLLGSLSAMSEGLRELIARVRHNASDMAHATAELAQGKPPVQAKAGVEQVRQAGDTSEAAVQAAQRVSTLMSEIAAATQEQASGIDEINRAVMQMDQVTQQNATLVEQATAATDSLEAQAGLLTYRPALAAGLLKILKKPIIGFLES